MTQHGTLQTAFIDELRDMYDAERQLTKALPKLAKHANAPDLRTAFESHLDETQTHIQRIESVFEQLDEKVRGKRCAGIAGIIEESSDVMALDFDDATMDAAIIAAGQRAEHYEIAAYGTLVSWARSLGHDEAADLLEASLEEEKAADRRLTELAMAGINLEALSGDADDEESDGADAEEGDMEEVPAGGRPSQTMSGKKGRR